MFFYAMVVKIRKEVRGSMQDTKFHKITGAVVLILIIVIYSFYRMHDTDAVTISVGVDNSKIGIVESGKNPVFIELCDVIKVELAEEYSPYNGQEYEVYTDDKIGEYILIWTEDKKYVVNTNNKKTTRTGYEQIQKAIGK